MYNKSKVLKFMRMNVQDYIEFGEVNCTKLAEGAGDEFDFDHEGGPLDDESHEVWELALKVAEEYDADGN